MYRNKSSIFEYIYAGGTDISIYYALVRTVQTAFSYNRIMSILYGSWTDINLVILIAVIWCEDLDHETVS